MCGKSLSVLCVCLELVMEWECEFATGISCLAFAQKPNIIRNDASYMHV